MEDFQNGTRLGAHGSQEEAKRVESVLPSWTQG